MSDRLRHLAWLKGIAASYFDIWGHEVQAADATLRSLLVAMRVLDAPEASLAEIETTIAVHESRQHTELLPPVHVVHEDDMAWRLPVRAPQTDTPDVTLAWRIDTEDGSVQQGRVGADGASAEPLAVGYHRLTLLRENEPIAHCALIVAPRRCYQPPALQGTGRVWGFAAQLYALRSERNWGIGDFSDLTRLVGVCAGAGAAVVGVNPLHAMFPHNPAHASPYSPSSRLFLNLQYLDVEAIADFADCSDAHALVRNPAFSERLAALRRSELVDHVGVAKAKREALEKLFAHFRREHVARGSDRAKQFDQFRQRHGMALHRHALFDALQAHFHAANAAVWGWPVWPEAYRDPDSTEVAAFAREHIEAVEFHEYLQWQADLQLAAAGRRAAQLDVGLYVDLAVSIDRAGAEAWSSQSLYALNASIGAPPDEYNPKGQNWGLPPLDPVRLRAAGYAPFIAMLRANMAHAGALRIDHVMGLMRLYWIAPGAEASSGAYVHYPFDDLLAIVALESQRNRCLVIGEDLGTVHPEVRTKLAAAGVLSYGVLFFERGPDGEFKPPSDQVRQSVAVVSTHDLPTLVGWWEARDLAQRQQLGLFPRAEVAEQQLRERAHDRERLLRALAREQLLPADTPIDPTKMPALNAACVQAVHAYQARGQAQIVVAQLEDMLLAAEQVNLPGTTDEVPNWRRKLALPIESWHADPRFTELTRVLRHERPRASTGPRTAKKRRASADVPRATYRVQLHREFGFADATALVPYWAELGISHLYTSPPLRARPGSQHGYDVVDHGELNPELGTRTDFDVLVQTLHDHGMGLLIDIVPNHMGVLSDDNAWWLDVLENGAASAYAQHFDIEWHSPDPALTGKVLIPILGDQYGIVLERGEIKLGFDAARGYFTLSYYEHQLPIDPAGYGPLIRMAVRASERQARPTGTLASLTRLAEAFDRLPAHHIADEAARATRQRDKTLLKAQLAATLREQPAMAAALAAVAASMNGQPGNRTSFDRLDALIDAQPYRLAQWRTAGDEINYRRFFDVNELAALRMEREEVFEATHRLVLDLATSGAVDGLRIDHPDGLADPAGYFQRLQQRYAQLAGLPAPPSHEGDANALPLYVVVEKIVAPHEQVPPDWAVHGTTGYRFANVINGLMIDGDAKMRLDRAWHAFVRDEAEDFETLSWHCRHVVMDGALAGELTILSAALLRLAREDRRTRDFTLNSLRQALSEVIASFPVYRTYIVDKASAQDRKFIDWAIGRARRRSLAADASVFDFLRRVLLGRPLPGAPAGLVERYRVFARRLQQYTAPVAAKGIEDTALYRHHRLISVNDVGGEPDAFGMSVAAFHAASRDRALHWPHTMLATSTHDAKRSEDVRLRIDVISEMPAAWRLTVRRWSRINRSHKRTVDGERAPTRNDEYLLYQMLVGSLPAGDLDDEALAAYALRVDAAMLKSVRESKAVTSWINPNLTYEAALSAFVHTLLERRDSNLFLPDLQTNAAVFAWYGALNGLTMATLKSLSPGVPDYYQGCEAIELSLVDPDNRRAIDYERRREMLTNAQAIAAQPDRAAALRELLAHAVDGRAKFHASWCALQLRREHDEMLRDAEYVPLEARGERAAHVVAFARRSGTQWVVVVGVRLFASLGLNVGDLPIGAVWGDTELVWPEMPDDQLPPLEDAISGRQHAVVNGAVTVAELLREFPVAALFGASPAAHEEPQRAGAGAD